MPDSELGGQFDGAVHQVSGPGHNEFHVAHNFEHLLGGVEEILRPFLHCDSPEEQDYLLVAADAGICNGPLAVAVAFNTVVDYFDFVPADAVSADYDASRKMAHSDDFCCSLHTLALDVINHLVDVLAAAVEFRGVDVHYKRPSTDCCDGDTRGVCHPVVRVDNIELLVLGQIDRQRG